MTMPSLEDIVRHPLTIISGAVGVVAGNPFQLIEPLLTALWANPGPLFTASSVTTFTIAPEVEWIPSDALTVVTIVFGVIFVASLLTSWGRSFYSRYTEDNS